MKESEALWTKKILGKVVESIFLLFSMRGVLKEARMRERCKHLQFNCYYLRISIGEVRISLKRWEETKQLVPMEAWSHLFHDDPYIKVMQAFNATNDELTIPSPRASIAPPTILPPSPVLPPSPLFDPQDFFLPEEILPPQK
ncbi:hypothetical protein Tco_1547913 [Tanacetum coccineum]